ncbi:MAG: bifunctional RNase H/acid phosphatase [Streptosporangiales bacterium]|nr:bifunctional RNase H/acid phosphatase [Streptosporangiales bacterium]MBO0891854.1 bifunctional RNase H/acid phosphatase [Acidothermales bacterium]
MRLRVEADGGSRGNPGPAGYGAVVRDADSGEVLAEASESIGVATNNVAEYRGLVAGLTAARDVDADADVEVAMDSKLVVEQMRGRWQVKHPDLRPLAVEARRLASGFGSVSYDWVPRARNAHADRLANEAMDAAVGTGTSRPAPPTALPDGGPADERENARTFVPPQLGTPTRTVLLRHGQTAAARDGWFNGSGDEPLTDEGRAQAAAVTDVLAAGERVDAVVASPLRRARETADIVAAKLDLPVREEEDLREAAFGEWEGLAISDIAARFPGELERWISDPGARPPGGESMRDVRRRAARARDKILARYPKKTVLVVAHGMLLAVLISVALDVPVEVVYRLRIETTALSSVDWYAGGYARLTSFNDTTHLITP